MQDWTKDQKQLDLFWQRSQAAGVNRRDFMKILAAASATAKPHFATIKCRHFFSDTWFHCTPA